MTGTVSRGGEQIVLNQFDSGVINGVVRGLNVGLEEFYDQVFHTVTLQECKDDRFNYGDHDSIGVAVLFRI